MPTFLRLRAGRARALGSPANRIGLQEQHDASCKATSGDSDSTLFGR